MRRLIVIGLSAWAMLAAADERPVELARLFPLETDIFTERTGLSRIVLPPGVLRACRPDLSDVRIFDREGREVPFVTDSGVGQDEVREAGVSVRAEIVDVRRDSATHAEAYDLKMPDPPPAGGQWRLIINSARREFERTIEITGIRNDGVDVVVVPQTSFFRLPGVAAEQTSFTLPTIQAVRLRVAISGGADGFLDPAISFESVRRLESAERATVLLAEVRRDSSGGTSVIELARPPGIAPDMIRVETVTPAFSRAVRVFDVGATGSESLLGTGNLFRVPSQPPIEDRALRVRPARGERLRVEIRDQDSPPLEDVRFVAVVQQPVLIFALAPGADGGPAGTLRFGGGRARHAGYDLAGLIPTGSHVTGDPARVAMWLYDPAEVGGARLGDVRNNAAFDQTPALAFAMHASDAIDVSRFALRQTVSVNPSPEGLSRLRLSAADSAAARPDLADLRIVDATSHQWPYLLERNAASEWLDLSVSVPARRDHTSRYTFVLPASRLRFDQLLVDVDAPYFHRPFRLVTATDRGDERVVAQGQLTRAAGASGAVTVAMQPVEVERLALVIEDGDDAPLVLRGVRARRQTSDLYLAAPAGEYFLLVGQPDAEAPRYELAAVRDVVLAASSAPAKVGKLEKKKSKNDSPINHPIGYRFSIVDLLA